MKKMVPIRKLIDEAEEQGENPDLIFVDPDSVFTVSDDDFTNPESDDEEDEITSN